MERLQFDSKPEHLQDGYGFEVTTIYFFLLIPVGGSKQQQKWLIRSQVGCESRTSIPTWESRLRLVTTQRVEV